MQLKRSILHSVWCKTKGAVHETSRRSTTGCLKYTVVGVPGTARNFLPESTSMQTLLQCPDSPRVQSHQLTSVHTLKIQNTSRHIPLFGHTDILQSLVEMGSVVLAAGVLYPGKATRIPWPGVQVLVFFSFFFLLLLLFSFFSFWFVWFWKRCRSTVSLK